MAIYLGDTGLIELSRRSVNETLAFILNPEDVDTEANRFSFDGIMDEGLLLNGDRVEFLRLDGEEIELLEGVSGTDGITRYVNVDSIGGIRLYEFFQDAVNDNRSKALTLIKPSENQEIRVSLQDVQYRCLAQVTDYEVTTQRETIDLTLLGEEFRRQYGSGLISGQGSLTAFWDLGSTIDQETVHYMTQLVQRLEMGAMFDARFFIKKPGAGSIDFECDTSAPTVKSVWWEVVCIATNSSMTFTPDQLLRTQIQFVTSGPFTLKIGQTSGAVLQEDTGLILEEQTQDILAQDSTD